MQENKEGYWFQSKSDWLGVIGVLTGAALSSTATMYLPKKELYDNKSNMQAMLMGQKFMYCINRFFRNVSLFMAVGGVYSLGNTLDLAPKFMDNNTGLFLG